jgi:hypothetical protein
MRFILILIMLAGSEVFAATDPCAATNIASAGTLDTVDDRKVCVYDNPTVKIPALGRAALRAYPFDALDLNVEGFCNLHDQVPDSEFGLNVGCWTGFLCHYPGLFLNSDGTVKEVFGSVGNYTNGGVLQMACLVN